MASIRVIGFDLDDTLWDSKPVLIKAEACLDEWLSRQVPELRYTVTEMRELRSLVLDDEPELIHYITEFRRRVIERAMQLSGIAADKSRTLSGAAMDVFLAARNRIELPQDTVDTMAVLARQFTLGALTNGNADIHSLGLSQYFAFAFSAEEVGAAKPAPDLFEAALRHTDSQPAEMVYVGDDPVLDIDPAKSVGLHTILMENPRKREAGETRPDEIITRIADLPAAIERLMGRL